MSKVNVIYHQFPHYRSAIMRELSNSKENEYVFWGSVEPYDGIKPFSGDEVVQIKNLKIKQRGKFIFLKGYWPAVMDPTASRLLILGNINMPASWLAALIGRLLGKKIFFWGHGWLKREPLLKKFSRLIYYSLAHKILVYGERAKELGTIAGYPESRIHVIYNSLDYNASLIALDKIRSGKEKNPPPQSLFENSERPLVICTARLTRLCRFDILFEAAAKLQREKYPINILLVGDGPEKDKLTDLARKLRISAVLFGACYDENLLANMIYNSDVTVSPGKIGLTVIHSLMYGTPAITHGNLDEQMPEVEAITPGVTGGFFERNNSDDLARCLKDWLTSVNDRESVRENCLRVVADKWNPHRQCKEIDKAVSELQ